MMPGKIYYGNESFAETVQIFAQSRVVVGYHGAGLANTLFCSSGTIVLEYTTFHDMNATKLWRSNEKGIAGKHGHLKWLKHTIDVDRLANMTDLRSSTDVDHYIKGLRYVELTGSTLFNSVQRVKEELERAELTSLNE
jgi:hypothetical protein